MLTLEEAIKIIESEKNNRKVIHSGESDDKFVFLLSDNNGDESYDTVDKKTGEIGWMWFWDFGILVTDKKAKWIN